MQLAAAPTFNGRVLSGCSLAGFSEAPAPRPIRSETCCLATFGKRRKVSLIH